MTKPDLPWTDCKVAFDVSYDRLDALWDATDDIEWPHGWKFIETDGSGARAVAIFRVEFMLTEAAGQRVAELLKPYQG